MKTAKDLLDAQYQEMRWRALSLAADFDRLDRSPGANEVKSDVRIAALKRCIQEVLSDQPGRAERVQLLLSDKTPPPSK
jgi:hypothetical protein